MVPDDNRASSGTGSIDPGDLYVVVRKAIEDAILSVIATLLLVGLAFGLVWFGVVMAVSSYDASPLMALGGGLVVLVGLYLAASELDVIPAVTDLL